MAEKKISLLLTCEHGGNRVPAAFKKAFQGASRALKSDRGWDGEALDVARLLSRKLKAPLIAASTTRLLVDLNRSVGNEDLFSEFTRDLPPSLQQKILREHYFPYRKKIETRLMREKKFALHLSIHSFAARKEGKIRKFEIGILFDPKRRPEAKFARELRARLELLFPDLRVKFNEPYAGTDDGLTTLMRKQKTRDHYAGIEIEMNQAFLSQTRKRGSREIFVQGLAAAITMAAAEI